MMKKIGITNPKNQIEQLTNSEMYDFIKRSIKGGKSCVGGKRYSKPNKEFCIDFELNKEPASILYIDANNLYGYGMIYDLPIKNYKWIDIPKDLTDSKNIYNFLEMLANKKGVGYFVDLDVDYNDRTLQDYTYDYPLLPIKEQRNPAGHCKIYLTHENKKNYILNLILLMESIKISTMGLSKNTLKITKIHKILQYDAEP